MLDLRIIWFKWIDRLCRANLCTHSASSTFLRVYDREIILSPCYRGAPDLEASIALGAEAFINKVGR